MKNQLSSSFVNLTPDFLFESLNPWNYFPTGRLLQLNSYENRVYEVECEDKEGSLFSVIVKVYRPLRWSIEAIKEEHLFLQELLSHGVPAVAPLTNEHGETFLIKSGLVLSVFPKALGRMPQEFNSEELKAIAIKLAQLHNVGSIKAANYRITYDVEDIGLKALEATSHYIYPELENRYFDLAENIFDSYEQLMDGHPIQRIHADCHKGNILQTDPKEAKKEYFFVDFDDFCMGPIEQDLWMLILGLEEREQKCFLEAYFSLRSETDFNSKLFPLLQAMRIIHYAGWIGRRWSDPSFPKLFPQYTSFQYWQEEVIALEKVLESI